MSDLNIENYSFEDLLKLFELSENFNDYELKNAKKIVLRLHPDKSGLPSEYFLFYSKAYKMLYNIWKFKNLSIDKNENGLWKKDDDLDMNMDESLNEKRSLVSNKSKKMDVREFNKWFNDEFEKTMVPIQSQNGYDDWFKNEKDDIIVDHDIEEHKKRVRDIIVYDGVHELPVHSSGYSELRGDDKENGYTSDIFSLLPYQDLYAAHTIPVIPVSEKDFSEDEHFQSVDAYKKHSDALVNHSINNQQGTAYFKEKEKKDNEESTHIAYLFAKEAEESARRNSLFWSKFNLLE